MTFLLENTSHFPNEFTWEIGLDLLFIMNWILQVPFFNSIRGLNQMIIEETGGGVRSCRELKQLAQHTN